MIQYFESHAHYDDRRFDGDRYDLLTALPGKGVAWIINAGADLPSSKASVQLAEAFPYVYATVGVHPHEAKTLTEEGLRELEALCAHPKAVAVGETGLDFYYDHSPKDVQRYWFKRQLKLAENVNLPVIIHSRDAAQETFDTIKASNIRKGIIHSYSGGVPMAMEYISMGFLIGIGGVVTFDKTKRLIEVTAAIPLDKIVIETDAPYLTPHPHRGKRNDSSYLCYIAEAIARIKGISPETAAKQTYENAQMLFQIHSPIN
jgi:TatD DNase family protein